MTMNDDLTRMSQSFGEAALAQIKGYGLAAEPRNFELWYVYVSGYHTQLSDAVNVILERSGTITQAQVDEIHDIYLSQQKLQTSVDNASTRVVDEIEQVLAMIAAAEAQTNAYRSNLNGASEKLNGSISGDGLSAVIASLLRSTREIEANNRALEQRLQASCSEIKTLQDNLDAVRTEALTDQLTGLGNRKLYDQIIARAMAAAEKGEGQMSLMVTDIDHFKRFNDTFGHVTGDQVLRLVAHTVQQNIKGQDIACRYGGEEFVMILPGTPLKAAVTVAEHIRQAVSGKQLVKRSTGESLGHVTISIGVATWQPGETAVQLYERADVCLYAAKRSGRNRVVSEADLAASEQLIARVA